MEDSEDLLLLFNIPTVTRKYFFEICRQFGHVPSKMFASSDLGCSLRGGLCDNLVRKHTKQC